MQVFISWSGQRAKAQAEALYRLLRRLIQRVHPWMSEHDIKPGELWFAELQKGLAGSAVAVICVTNENLERPWLLFEAGAIGARLNDNNKVIPYLLDFDKSKLHAPLSLFQGLGVREDTRRLVNVINSGFAETERVRPDELDDLWEKCSPDFFKHIDAIPPTEAEPPKAPSTDERLESIHTMIERLIVSQQATRAQGRQPSLFTSRAIDSMSLGRLNIIQAALKDALNEVAPNYDIDRYRDNITELLAKMQADILGRVTGSAQHSGYRDYAETIVKEWIGNALHSDS